MSNYLYGSYINEMADTSNDNFIAEYVGILNYFMMEDVVSESDEEILDSLEEGTTLFKDIKIVSKMKKDYNKCLRSYIKNVSKKNYKEAYKNLDDAKDILKNATKLLKEADSDKMSTQVIDSLILMAIWFGKTIITIYGPAFLYTKIKGKIKLKINILGKTEIHIKDPSRFKYGSTVIDILDTSSICVLFMTLIDCVKNIIGTSDQKDKGYSPIINFSLTAINRYIKFIDELYAITKKYEQKHND